MSQEKRKISCPTCSKQIIWDTSSPWRPFCSERCRLIDLGEWLDEGYKIPDKTDPGSPFLPPEFDPD
ncbi:MAG: DNA gyrase inhibitor YacG [Sedimenticola sp.]|jgi:hypothetical protein|nr:MAG: DNA gyrase inhibitor YacG [Sedimenticola sp.]